MESKTFELSYSRNVYFGEYSIGNGGLSIDNVHTFDSDEKRVEIDSFNDIEIYSKILSLLKKEKSEEIESELEEMEAEKTSRLRDF